MIKTVSGRCSRAILVASIILLSCFTLIGCDSTANLTAPELVARARDYEDAGKYREAVIELKNALKKEPENVEARWVLGNIYLQTGNGAAAEKELRRAIDLGMSSESAVIPLLKAGLQQGNYQEIIDNAPAIGGLSEAERSEAMALFGSAHMHLGDITAATDMYENALRLNPHNLSARIGQAQAIASIGEVEEAHRLIKQVLSSDPDSAEAWKFLGDLEMYVGNLVEAEEAYTQAIANRPPNGEDYIQRALVRIALARYEQAAEDLDMVRKIAPASASLPHLQGVLHFQRKEYERAQAAFDEALGRNPNFAQSMFYLGATHIALGNFAQAENSLSRFLLTRPRDTSHAKTLLAVIRLHDNEVDEAEKLLRQVLAQRPDDVKAVSMLANILMSRGEEEEANVYIEKMLTLQPETGQRHIGLGLAFLLYDQPEKSLEHYRQAVELEPDSIEARTFLIMGQLNAKQYDEALVGAEALRADTQDSPMPLNLIGRANIGKGEQGLAREAFKQALELAPGDPAAGLNLATLAVADGEDDLARSFYKQVIGVHPDNRDAMLSLVNLEMRTGNIKQGKELLEKLVADAPQDLKANVLLARFYLRAGNADKALEITQAIQGRYPRQPELLATIGEAQLADGQTEAAVTTLQSLVKHTPEAAHAHFLLAKAISQQGYKERSAQALDQALELDPNHVLAMIARSRQLMSDGHAREANAYFEKVKRLYPDDPEVLAQAGWLAMQQDRPAEAVVFYERALEAIPTSTMVSELARAQWQAGQRQESQQTLKAWLEKYPDDVSARYQLAERYVVEKHYADARKAFADLLRISPNHVLALNNLAWHLREEDPDRAIEYARRANELAPGVPQIQDTLAVLLMQNGEVEPAVRLLQRATEAAPDDPGMRYHLARALHLRGGGDAQAIDLLNAVLNENKPFAEREDARALLEQLTQ